MGVSATRLAQTVIIVASLLMSFSASVFVWRVQFIDPSISGIPVLIELLTVSIIAFRPQIRSVAFASIFVTFLPEAMRFLDLPSSTFGQLRILIYCILLLVLLHTFAKHFHFSKRTV